MLTIEDLQKKTAGTCVFVNLWATWCEPCLQELPALVKFLEKQKKITPVLIDVSLSAERKKSSQKFLDAIPTPFATYFKPDGNDEKYITSIDPTWQGSLPFSMLYVKGQKKKIWNGPIEPADLAKAAKQFCPSIIG